MSKLTHRVEVWVNNAVVYAEVVSHEVWFNRYNANVKSNEVRYDGSVNDVNYTAHAFTFPNNRVEILEIIAE